MSGIWLRLFLFILHWHIYALTVQTDDMMTSNMADTWPECKYQQCYSLSDLLIVSTENVAFMKINILLQSKLEQLTTCFLLNRKVPNVKRKVIVISKRLKNQ